MRLSPVAGLSQMRPDLSHRRQAGLTAIIIPHDGLCEILLYVYTSMYIPGYVNFDPCDGSFRYGQYSTIRRT